MERYPHISQSRLGAKRYFVGRPPLKIARSHIGDIFDRFGSPEIKSRPCCIRISGKELGAMTQPACFENYYDKAGGANPMARIQYVDVKTYLTDDILVKWIRRVWPIHWRVRAPCSGWAIYGTHRIPTSLKLKGTSGKDIF